MDYNTSVAREEFPLDEIYVNVVEVKSDGILSTTNLPPPPRSRVRPDYI